MEELINFLQTSHPPSTPFINYISNNATTLTLSRKQVLIEPGRSLPDLCFIEKGLVRRYHVLNKKEICSRFLKEGDLILGNQEKEKSMYTYQALEISRVIFLTNNKRTGSLYKHFPELNIIARKVLSIEIQNSDRIASILRYKKAKERYQALVDINFELISRIPSRYLSSYLNISEGTISRIRGGKY